MKCPRLDSALAAVHAGEPVSPDCPECARAVADEQRFARLVERGLAAVRPLSPIAPQIEELIRAERKVRRPVARAPRRGVAVVLSAAAAAAAALALLLSALALHRDAPPPDVVVRAPSRPAPRFVWPARIPSDAPPASGAPPVESATPPPPAPPEKPQPPADETGPPEVEADLAMAKANEAPAGPGKSTVAGATSPSDVLCRVRAGALSMWARDRWTRVARVVEGMLLRADGRTRVDLAGARLTLDDGSKFSLRAHEISLTDGGLSAEVPGGAELDVMLGGALICAQPAYGRVLLSARPDRVVVDEGVARWGEIVLGEGVEHEVRSGTLQPRRGRTLAGAARPREALTWRLDLNRENMTREELQRGRVEGRPGARVLLSAPVAGADHTAEIGYCADAETTIFVARQTTAVRFRCLVREAAPLWFMIRNRTKNECYGTAFEAAPGVWTTVTLFVLDLPPCSGEKASVARSGDKYDAFGWCAGQRGQDIELRVEGVQVVEVER